jgi:hypothetical protein
MDSLFDRGMKIRTVKKPDEGGGEQSPYDDRGGGEDLFGYEIVENDNGVFLMV